MHLNELAGLRGELHTEHGGSLGAESLTVHEIAPATHDLPHQQTHDHKVCHGKELKAPFSLAAGKAKTQNDHGDDRAVNGEAAVPEGDGGGKIELAVRVAETIQIEQDIVDPRPHDAHRDAPEQAVIEVILADAVLFALAQRQQQRQKDAQGNEDAVPVHPVADVDGLGAGGERPVAEKPGETDGAVGHDHIIHIYHSITPSDKQRTEPCAPDTGSPA